MRRGASLMGMPAKQQEIWFNKLSSFHGEVPTIIGMHKSKIDIFQSSNLLLKKEAWFYLSGQADFRNIFEIVSSGISIEKVGTFSHGGGTCPLYMHENISSSSVDITTRPCIPRSRSMSCFLIMFNNALYLSISCSNTTFRGDGSTERIFLVFS